MSIIATNIEKSFGEPPVDVLKGISLQINDGEFVALTGRSGSGKSTLMYILSSLDNPTKGKLEISGKNLAELTDEELHQFRNEQLGFVFQSAYMIAELTVIENTAHLASVYSKSVSKQTQTSTVIGCRLTSFPESL